MYKRSKNIQIFSTKQKKTLLVVSTMVTTKPVVTTESMVSEPETMVTEVNMADAMVTVSMVTIHIHGCRRYHYSLRWWSVPIRRRIVRWGSIAGLRRRWGYHLWCLVGRHLAGGWGRWGWVGTGTRWVFLHLGFEG